jgi:hypothetical protein
MDDAVYTVRRNALSQPVEYTAEQLEDRIAGGLVSRDALVSENGAPPTSWTMMPRFSHLAGVDGLGTRMTGQRAAVGGDPEALLRAEASRRARERRQGMTTSSFAVRTGSFDSISETASHAAVAGARSTGSYPRVPLTRPADPDHVAINQQWRNRPAVDMYRALLDVPATEVFGLPWSAERNTVSLALLRLQAELEKEAPKDESAENRSWREQIFELLAAVHSAYVNPAHQRPVLRLQEQYERTPFVSEVTQFYMNVSKGRAQTQTKSGVKSERDIIKDFGLAEDGSVVSTGAAAKKGPAGSGASAGPVDPIKAAEQKRIRMYLMVGAVLGVLALLAQFI